MSTIFNMQAWLNYATGKTDSYRFANPENSSDPRTEYRQGLMNSAKGIISIFDTVGENGKKDGKTSLEEYYNEQNYYMKNNPGVTEPYDLEAQKYAWKQEFKTLDLNGDGYLDYKERANELTLLDANKSTNAEDGSIDRGAANRVFADKNKSQLRSALEDRYDIMKLKNLGEPGDIKQTGSVTGEGQSLSFDNADITKIIELMQNFLQNLLPMMSSILTNFVSNQRSA